MCDEVIINVFVHVWVVRAVCISVYLLVRV